MFDIAFSELVVIFLVALVVIGPERLPKVARAAGHLWGRMQRYVQGVKNDIANDMAIEEASRLRDSIHREVSIIEQSARNATLTVEQEILQARHGKSPGAADERPVSQAPSIPSKPV